MESLSTLLARFERIDKGINQWLVLHSHTLLRVFTGLAFLEFGLVKYMSGTGPLNELTNQVTAVLTAGLLSSSTTTDSIAVLECVTGLCFLGNRFLQLAVWILALQLIASLAPLVLFSTEQLKNLSYAPTQVAQYLITEVVLVAVGIFIAANWTGSQLLSATKPVNA